MLKISYIGCLGLSLAISAQFTLKCVSLPEIAKQFTKNPYVESSKTFKVVDVDTKLATLACYDKQDVCA